MQLSANYSLKLMEGTDNVKRQDFVDNFTSIDIQMKTINDNSYPTVTATGTNAYVGTTDRIKSLGKGTKLTLFVSYDATGNSTLNLNSYGVKNIKDSFGNIVTNLKKDIPYNLCYNGTDFILQGKGGGGDADPSQVLNGKKYTNDSGPQVGTMANNGAVQITPGTTNKAIPKGYHDGNGYVVGDADLISANIKAGANILGVAGSSTVVDTANAFLDPQYLLQGYSGYDDGVKKDGTMPIWNPSYGDHWETGTTSVGAYTYGNGANYAYMSIPNKQYVNNINWVCHYEPYLFPQNIVSGANIFGVVGSATIESLGGKRKASGSTATPDGVSINVNLGFQPSAIIVSTNYSNYKFLYDSDLGYNMRLASTVASGSFFSVTSTGFTLTNIGGANGTVCNWIAYS